MLLHMQIYANVKLSQVIPGDPRFCWRQEIKFALSHFFDIQDAGIVWQDVTGCDRVAFWRDSNPKENVRD